MRGTKVLLVLAALAAAAAAPPAAGEQPLVGSPICGEGAVCAPSGLCLEGVACQPTLCDPATDCEARAAHSKECQRNLTIDGETCVQRVGVDAAAGGRSVPLPGTHVLPGTPVPGARVPVPGSSAGVEADLSHGFVQDENLPNHWVSHAATVHLVVADVDLGRTGVALYNSTIEGGNDTSPHRFTRTGVALRHEGAFTSAGAAVGVLFLDGAPEECSARVETQARSAGRSCTDPPPSLP